jgi:excisionase family DNA binding protein
MPKAPKSKTATATGDGTGTTPVTWPADLPQYVSAAQAARVLNVPRSWVYAQSAAGTLAGARKIGRYLRINLAELVQWAESQR